MSFAAMRSIPAQGLIDGWSPELRLALARAGVETQGVLRTRDAQQYWSLSAGFLASRVGLQPIGEASFRIGDLFSHVELHAGVERTTVLERTASVRPYVLVGTVATPATPHDTLTTVQAAEREQNGRNISLRGLAVPVLSFQARASVVQWDVRLGFPRLVCCAIVAGATQLPRGWLDVNLRFPIIAGVAVDIAGGTFRHSAISDVGAGRPYTRVGIVFGTRGVSGASRDTNSAPAIYFRIVPLDSLRPPGDTQHVRLRLWAPGATSVAVRGDFSNWTVLPLLRARAGQWEVDLPISAGLHTISLTLDGERWRCPPGLPGAPDDFDGATGVFLVADETR